MTRAVLSPAAERDILGIVAWIAGENPAAAKGFREALNELATAIGEHPRVATLKRHPASPPIVRVLRGACDLPEALRDV